MRSGMRRLAFAGLAVVLAASSGCYRTVYRERGYGGSAYAPPPVRTPYERRDDYRRHRGEEHRAEDRSGYDYNGNGVIGR